jgi:hypothetical protein
MAIVKGTSTDWKKTSTKPTARQQRKSTALVSVTRIPRCWESSNAASLSPSLRNWSPGPIAAAAGDGGGIVTAFGLLDILAQHAQQGRRRRPRGRAPQRRQRACSAARRAAAPAAGRRRGGGGGGGGSGGATSPTARNGQRNKSIISNTRFLRTIPYYRARYTMILPYVHTLQTNKWRLLLAFTNCA